MAESKDYIVRYLVNVDAAGAKTALQNIARAVRGLPEQLTGVSTRIADISKNIKVLKESASFTLYPTIDTAKFEGQLKAMTRLVEEEAAKMQRAIYGALTNSSVKNAVKNSAAKATLPPSTKAEMQRALAGAKTSLTSIIGKDGKGGSLAAAQKANNIAEIKSLEAKRDALRANITDLSAKLAQIDKATQKLDEKAKKVVSQQSKAVAAPASKATSSKPPYTNVTTATIKAWEKAFGKAGSRTMTLRLRATADGPQGAYSVIRTVSERLNELQSKGTFTITPLMNSQAYTKVESQLRTLATLSGAITAPFTNLNQQSGVKSKTSGKNTILSKEDQAKLNEAQKQVKSLNEKITPVQSRLNKNLAITEGKRTRGVKAQITKDTKTLSSLNSEMEKQNAIVSGIQNKASGAGAPKGGVKPFAIDIVGTLTKINVGATPPEIPLVGNLTKITNALTSPEVSVVGKVSKLTGTVAEAIPVNIKILQAQAQQAVTALTPPVMDVKLNVLKTGVNEQISAISKSLNQGKSGSKKGTASSTNQNAEENVKPVVAAGKTEGKSGVKGKSGGKGKSSVAGAVDVLGKVDTKGIIKQIKEIAPQTVRVMVKLGWANGVVGKQQQIKELENKLPAISLKLNTGPALAELEAFISKVRAASPQNITLTASGAASSAARPIPPTIAAPGTYPGSYYGTAPSIAGATSGSTPLFPMMPAGSKTSSPASGGNAASPAAANNKSNAKASTTPPSGFRGSGGSRIFWGNEKPSDSFAPKGYHWEQTSGLASRLNGSEAAAYQTALQMQAKAERVSGWANKNLETLNKQTQKLNKKVTTGTKMLSSQPWAIMSLQEQIAEQEKLRAVAKSSLNKDVAKYHQARTEDNLNRLIESRKKFANIGKKLSGLKSQLSFWQSLPETVEQNKAVLARTQARSGNLGSYIQSRQAGWTNAMALPSQYSNGWQLAKEGEARATSTPITRGSASAGNIQKAQRLSAQLNNALMPFVSNKEQLNTVIKNRKFFRQAIGTTGITPTVGMSNTESLRYLYGVSDLMHKANVPIPIQLQKEINRVQKQVTKEIIAVR